MINNRSYNNNYDDNEIIIFSKNEYDTEKIFENISVVIVVCIYYEYSIQWYCDYLNRVPEKIPIEIFSSNSHALSKCKKLIVRRRVGFHIKNNKGRDVSTMLVAARKLILEYDFFCFIHDKEANADYLKDDAEMWRVNLWENMLASKNYIYNILKAFSDNEKLGLLVPPEPYGNYYSHWYGDVWFENYENTLKLAKRIGVSLKSFKNSFVTLSTVFWARTSALKKLLNYNWTYEDFVEEPIAIDGTISHAIERILGYVAYDAGFLVKTVMTTDYASKLLVRVQNDMRILFDRISKQEHIFNMYQIKIIEDWKEILKAFANTHNNILIYGAGNYGQSILRIMEDNGIVCSGFVVSTGRKKIDRYLGYDVFELSEVKEQKMGLIVGVSYEYREEIHMELRKIGFKDYIDGF